MAEISPVRKGRRGGGTRAVHKDKTPETRRESVKHCNTELGNAVDGLDRSEIKGGRWGRGKTKGLQF